MGFSENWLIDHHQYDNVLNAVFRWVSRSQFRHGIHFCEVNLQHMSRSCSPHADGLEEFVETEWQRAACQPRQYSASELLGNYCSKSRRKSINRARKRLS